MPLYPNPPPPPASEVDYQASCVDLRDYLKHKRSIEARKAAQEQAIIDKIKG